MHNEQQRVHTEQGTSSEQSCLLEQQTHPVNIVLGGVSLHVPVKPKRVVVLAQFSFVLNELVSLACVLVHYRTT